MPFLLLIPRGAGCVEEYRRPPGFPRNRTTDPKTDHAIDIKGEMTNMKISCLKEDLAHGLSVVNHAVPNRAPLPITQNVLLCAKDSKLKLSATNLEIFIITWAGAVVQEEGEITVPARLLTDLVNSLPNERIDLDLPEGSGLLHLTCARAKAHINSVDAKEFPPTPEVDEGMTVMMDPQALRTAISRTAFAAAAEDSRPALTGVEMKLSGSKFTMAAADGFRLAVHRGELAAEVESEATAIIPARTLTYLYRLLGNQEEPVAIAISTGNRHAMFRMQNTQVISQLIKGQFPDYEQLIPQKHETRTIFDSRELLRATRTAAIFAKGGSNIIRLEMEPRGKDEMDAKAIISAKSEEHGDNRDEITPESVEGNPGQNSLQQQLPAGGADRAEPQQGGTGDHGLHQPGGIKIHGVRGIRNGPDANVCKVVKNDGPKTPITPVTKRPANRPTLHSALHELLQPLHQESSAISKNLHPDAPGAVTPQHGG